MRFARFSRRRPPHLPTPLEHPPRVSQALGGPQIRFKRDGGAAPCAGGDRTRRLEFRVAEAALRGADIVGPQAAPQSNHAHQIAACAARLGVDGHILLADRAAGAAAE